MHKPLFFALFVAATTIHAAENQFESNEIAWYTVHNLDIDENGVESKVSEKRKRLIDLDSMMHFSLFVNAKNENGETFLMIAARKGDKPKVEMNLLKNPDVTLKNSESKTATTLARENGHLEIVYLINLHRFLQDTQ